MRICFIDPPGITKGLNVGLGYLASSLVREGHIVKVIDLNNNTRNIDERLNKIRNFDMIGISIKSSTAQSASHISEIIGRKDLVCGGVHVTIDGYNFLVKNLNFKVCVIGEGEETLVKLAETMEGDVSFRDIEGVIYRDKGEIIVNPRRRPIVDLDSLPFPNYEVFDSFDGTIVHYPLITSRGCPYSCIYCCVGEISGRRWRARTPKNVIKELEYAKSKYGSRDFGILDDNFTQDIKRAKKFCELLIDDKITMSWSCPNGIRADRLDEELATLMKESGCKSVSIGIESLDEFVFDNIKKGEKLDDIIQAINILKKHKIRVEGFFIIGIPGDNLQKTKLSIELSKKLHLDEAVWNLFVPYPGTRAWRWVNEETRILRQWTEGFHFGPKIKSVFETDEFSEKERIHAFKVANIKCKGYFMLIDPERSLLVNAFNMIKIIFKHDLRNFTLHVWYALRNFRKVWGAHKNGFHL